MMNRSHIILGATAVFSAAAGVAGGYLYGTKTTLKKLEEKYAEDLRIETELTKEFYARMNKKGDFSTPEGAAAVLLDDAVNAVREYQGDMEELGLQPVDEAVEEEQAGIIIRDVLRNPPINSVAGDMKSPYNVFAGPKKPYPISEEDFLSNESEYEQVSVTYYMGDGIVSDERDQVMDNGNHLVLGNVEMHWVQAEDEATIIYVRNDDLKTEFEVAKSEGTYSKEVLGLDD